MTTKLCLSCEEKNMFKQHTEAENKKLIFFRFVESICSTISLHFHNILTTHEFPKLDFGGTHEENTLSEFQRPDPSSNGVGIGVFHIFWRKVIRLFIPTK